MVPTTAPLPAVTARADGEFGVRIRRGALENAAACDSPAGDMPKGICWPGTVCKAAAAEEPGSNGSPTAEIGDSFVPPLMRRRESSPLSDSGGLNAEGMPGPQAPAEVLLHVAPPVGNHDEAAQAVEQVFDLRAATETQDETQKASATSSPGPLTLDRPKDRDIDDPQLRPKPADGCEVGTQNRQDGSQDAPGY
ncbi:unnamed protein product [Diplocarpon coronariae]|uniref:Iojap protein family n=1 Tax=Diplocarpon coronariae TaxID=2795749 RepID=A0A218YWK5_9HELO|nr:iojap protein family [Marssonina coronariae]